jgi:sugar lactone lactonase YvrE
VQFATQGQLRELAPCTFSPAGLAVDSSAQIAYWADGPAIYKCAVAGGPVQMVVNGLDFNPTSLALDLANMRIFCCDAGGGAVCCINLASAKTVRLVTGLALPVAVAVDVSANQLFWVEYNSGCLQKSDLAGQSVTRLLSDLTLPQSVAIDLVHQQLYWAAKTEIASCDYGGLGSVTAITLTPAQPNSNSRKLALDSEAQKLYWSDQASQTIQCLDLVDGILITVMSKALTSAFANPSGIALVQTLAG